MLSYALGFWNLYTKLANGDITFWPLVPTANASTLILPHVYNITSLSYSVPHLI